MSDDNVEEEVYYVEKIVNHRYTTDQGLQFFVQWHGYGEEDNTWIPEEDMNEGEIKKTYMETIPDYKAEAEKAEKAEDKKEAEDGEAADASANDDDDEYFVESIINHQTEKGKLQYWVKWVGYPDSDNSWVDDADLPLGDMKKKYDKEFKVEKPKRKSGASKSFPSCQNRMLNAMRSLDTGSKEGVSRQAVYNYIAANYPGTLLQSARKALKEGVEKKLISSPSSGRFKLTDEGRASGQKKRKSRRKRRRLYRSGQIERLGPRRRLMKMKPPRKKEKRKPNPRT